MNNNNNLNNNQNNSIFNHTNSNNNIGMNITDKDPNPSFQYGLNIYPYNTNFSYFSHQNNPLYPHNQYYPPPTIYNYPYLYNNGYHQQPYNINNYPYYYPMNFNQQPYNIHYNPQIPNMNHNSNLNNNPQIPNIYHNSNLNNNPQNASNSNLTKPFNFTTTKKLTKNKNEKNNTQNNKEKEKQKITNRFETTLQYHNAMCDECGMNPIVGYRYSSKVKSNYDLCQKCWNKETETEQKNYKKISFDTLKNDENSFVFEIQPGNKLTQGENKFLESFFGNLLLDDKTKKTDNKKDKTITKIQENLEFNIDKNKKIEEIDIKIETLQDLINLSDLYLQPDFKEKNYSINLKGIHHMKPALKELKSLIGLDKVKEKVLEQIIFFSQDLHNKYDFKELEEDKEEESMNPLLQLLKMKKKNTHKIYNKNESCLEHDDNLDMLHTVIEGPPGVGKTIFGKLLARIYLSLGITKKDTFKIVRRSDLVGEYLGQTAVKTQKAIDEALGGVLFIDEAYQLGNGAGRKIDSYSKECIDTLNQNLSEKKGQFICIIAGYKNELEENFFGINQGLKRRFAFRYQIDEYSWEELTDILTQKIKKIKWNIDKDTIEWLKTKEFLKDKIKEFPHFGGDIETLLLNIKISHGKRVFGKDIKYHKQINQEDIEKGYQRYLDYKKDKKEKDTTPMGMYL